MVRVEGQGGWSHTAFIRLSPSFAARPCFPLLLLNYDVRTKTISTRMDSTPPSTPSRKHHPQLGGPPLLSPSLALPPRLTRPLSSLSIQQRSPSSSRPSSTRPPSIASSFEISLDSLPNQDASSLDVSPAEDSNSAELTGGSSVASGSTSPTTLHPSDLDARSSSEHVGTGEEKGDVGKALREQLKRSLSGRAGTYAGKGKARAQDVFGELDPFLLRTASVLFDAQAFFSSHYTQTTIISKSACSCRT